MTALWYRLRGWMHRHPRLRRLAVAAINRFPALQRYRYRRGLIAPAPSKSDLGGFRQPLAKDPAQLDALGRRYWEQLDAPPAGDAAAVVFCQSTENG